MKDDCIIKIDGANDHPSLRLHMNMSAGYVNDDSCHIIHQKRKLILAFKGGKLNRLEIYERLDIDAIESEWWPISSSKRREK